MTSDSRRNCFALSPSAVTPTVNEIIQHLEEYFSDSNDGFSPLVGMGVRVARLVPWISAPVCGGMFPKWLASLLPDEIRMKS
jgi:hypothetical protein